MLLDDAEIHRLSIEDVRAMYDAGVIDDEHRVELIDGVLLDMTPPSPSHSTAVSWLNRLFVPAFDDLEVRVQDMLEIRGGFVLPDLMVIDPLPLDTEEQPRTARLVIEVCLTSQRRDRMKARRYAEAGVTEYWLVDLSVRTVFVHREPQETGYATLLSYQGGELRPLVGGPAVDLSALLRSG